VIVAGRAEFFDDLNQAAAHDRKPHHFARILFDLALRAANGENDQERSLRVLVADCEDQALDSGRPCARGEEPATSGSRSLNACHSA